METDTTDINELIPIDCKLVSVVEYFAEHKESALIHAGLLGCPKMIKALLLHFPLPLDIPILKASLITLINVKDLDAISKFKDAFILNPELVTWYISANFKMWYHEMEVVRHIETLVDRQSIKYDENMEDAFSIVCESGKMDGLVYLLEYGFDYDLLAGLESALVYQYIELIDYFLAKTILKTIDAQTILEVVDKVQKNLKPHHAYIAKSPSLEIPKAHIKLLEKIRIWVFVRERSLFLLAPCLLDEIKIHILGKLYKALLWDLEIKI